MNIMHLSLNRPTAFHEFREETKSFTFVNKELVIKQKWEDLGVAAVVWDAVSIHLSSVSCDFVLSPPVA